GAEEKIARADSGGPGLVGLSTCDADWATGGRDVRRTPDARTAGSARGVRLRSGFGGAAVKAGVPLFWCYCTGGCRPVTYFRATSGLLRGIICRCVWENGRPPPTARGGRRGLWSMETAWSYRQLPAALSGGCYSFGR